MLGLDIGIWGVLLLVGAGVISGALNAAAGGGSLISFPALLVVGYPPLLANITNNVAAWPGYVGGAWGYRRELDGQARRILLLAPVCAVGSVIGVLLVRFSSQSAFESIVPLLVLAACALLAIEPLVSRYRTIGWGAGRIRVSGRTWARPRLPSTAATLARPWVLPCWQCSD
ncbi:hypothetical protein BH23ACT11_BH23ACT11_23790 [soil metagenome]